MSNESMYGVLLAPYQTEKTYGLADKNRQIVFKVDRAATKRDVKQAVETLFEVEVSGVNVLNQNGKERRFGQHVGRRQNWKKAYVTLKEGHDISFNQ